MANKFRHVKNIPEQEEGNSAVNKPKNQPDNPPKERTDNPRKKIKTNKIAKNIRKAFVNIFGLGILRKINLRKNMPYFIMVIIMIIALIYNNLNTQSKKLKAEHLEYEITKINDMLMDVVEEEYNIDERREKELLQIAQDEGFQSSGYIPYTVKAEKKLKKWQ